MKGAKVGRHRTTLAIGSAAIMVVLVVALALMLQASGTGWAVMGARSSHIVKSVPLQIVPERIPASQGHPIETPQPLVPAGVETSFSGLGSCGLSYCWAPGEPVVAVGPTDIVETVNTQAAVYNKSTGAELALFPFETFWTGGTTESCVDPRAIYLPGDNRFAISCTDDTNSSSPVRFAISATSDPTGTWYKYAAPNSSFLDQDKILATSDKFIVAGNGSASEEIYVYNKSDILSGVANPSVTHLSTTESNLYQAAVEQTYTSDGYLIASYPGADEWLATISGTPAAKNVSLSETDVGSNSDAAPEEPSVPGGSLGGGDLDGRIYDAVYEAETSDGKPVIQYSTADQCGSPARDCVVSARIDLSGANPLRTYEQSIGQSGWDYTYGAVGLNAAGNVFEGYSRSNASNAPGAAVLGPGFDVTVAPATAGATSCSSSQTPPCDERWGDYLGTAIDPSDPSTVWVTGLYQVANGPYSWATVIAKVSPPPAPTVTGIIPTSGPTSGGTSVTITGTGLMGATAVSFGVKAATSFTVNSATQVTATAPAEALGTVDVTVTTPGGTSTTSSADRYTYTTVPVALPYTAITPTRICDTRAVQSGVVADQCNANGTGTGRLGPGGTLIVTVPSLPTGATAAVLNVTVTGTSAPSYLTAWPTGSARPNASNLNWVAGQTVPNLVEVTLGTSDQVSFYNASGSVDVVVDLEGYVASAAAGSGLYNPLAPTRICDTRAVQAGVVANQCNGNGTGTGTLGPGGTLTVQVNGEGGVPATGVSAVVLNVTVTTTSAASYLTAWPTGSTQPNASNLNWVAGQTVPNRVIVPVGSSGRVSLYNAYGSADVVVDVGGWFTDSSNPAATGASYVALSPSRICDTRAVQAGVVANQCNANGTSTGTLGPAGSRAVQVTGLATVPTGASAVVTNVTVTGPTAASYLTVWPDGTTRPNASDLNFVGGETVPNLTVAELGSDGALGLYNAYGSVDVVVDVEGYYTG